jgi:hypothetical protein
VTTQHSIIELSLDLNLFGDDVITGVFWRPASGFDELNVPEPGSFLLAASSLAAILLVYASRRRWAQR